MATNNQNQELEEPEPFQMPSPKQEKDIVTILEGYKDCRTTTFLL